MTGISGNIVIKVVGGDLNSANEIVIIKSSDLNALPSHNWEIVAKVPGDTVDIPLTVTPGQYKFSGYIKGFWNNSDFSQAVTTPPIVTATGISLILSRA